MPAPSKIVALVGKSQSPEALGTARELADLVTQRGIALRVEDQLAARLGCAAAAPAALRESDLCVVVGGDGTLIRAVKLLALAEVPIFGVNLGRLGFLTEVPRQRAVPLLTRALSGDYAVEPRIKLRARVWRGAEKLIEEDVVNDAVLNRGAFSRMVELRTIVDGAPVSRFRADGLIIATPTGSTAYNLSANGPILTPRTEGIVISPICPHTLTQRPLVVSDRSKVSIEVTASEGDLLLSLDGQSSAPLQTGDRVDLELAPTRALLVRNPEIDFFGILREKLRWGESV